jgi:hypothetical protein
MALVATSLRNVQNAEMLAINDGRRMENAATSPSFQSDTTSGYCRWWLITEDPMSIAATWIGTQRTKIGRERSRKLLRNA